MMITNWPKVELDGKKAPVIPTVCPNCMGKATMEWRYGHKYPFSNTRYYQTFYYCDVCSDLIAHQRKTKRLQWWLGIVLFIGLIVLIAVIMDSRSGTKSSGSTDPLNVILVISVFAIPLAVYFLIGVMRKKSKPLPANALSRTPTAYYTGKAFGGLGNKNVYRAQRQEWLDLLVELNPDSVADEIYSERVGAPKPQKEKPF